MSSQLLYMFPVTMSLLYYGNRCLRPWFSCRFLTVVPRVLADVYHSLGTQLPEALLALLPADFFSDESVAKDSVSPSASSPSLSSVSLPSERGERLRELRSRSANQRR